jgi:hypothetical protein
MLVRTIRRVTLALVVASAALGVSLVPAADAGVSGPGHDRICFDGNPPPDADLQGLPGC